MVCNPYYNSFEAVSTLFLSCREKLFIKQLGSQKEMQAEDYQFFQTHGYVSLGKIFTDDEARVEFTAIAGANSST